MSRVEKILQKAKENPQNLRYKEFCTLCEYFNMKLRKKDSGSSHRVYKRSEPPVFSMTIQNVDGFAVPYQVKQLLERIEQHGLADED